jgi:CRISPR type III-B/RAMP module-associated protein Cmr5
MQVFNSIKDAIDIYNEVYEKFLMKFASNKVKKSLRARAREMPSLIQEIGLLGVYSFCFGKGNKYYENFINCLENKDSNLCELKDEEDIGYTIYLYLILKGIKKIDLIDIDVNVPESFFRKINEIYKVNEASKIKIVEKLLLPYLSEIKRLCEGTLTTE